MDQNCDLNPCKGNVENTVLHKWENIQKSLAQNENAIIFTNTKKWLGMNSGNKNGPSSYND